MEDRVSGKDIGTRGGFGAQPVKSSTRPTPTLWPKSTIVFGSPIADPGASRLGFRRFKQGVECVLELARFSLRVECISTSLSAALREECPVGSLLHIRRSRFPGGLLARLLFISTRRGFWEKKISFYITASLRRSHCPVFHLLSPSFGCRLLRRRSILFIMWGGGVMSRSVLPLRKLDLLWTATGTSLRAILVVGLCSYVTTRARS